MTDPACPAKRSLCTVEPHLNATNDLESFPHATPSVSSGVSVLGPRILARPPPPVAAPAPDDEPPSEAPSSSPRSPGLSVLIRLHERIATLDASMVDILARETAIRLERQEIITEIEELESILRMHRAVLAEAQPSSAARERMQCDFERDVVRSHQ